MDAFVDFLLTYGYGGMFAAAFLAGSFFPFSSEAVMTGLRLAGLDVWMLVLCASVGNLLGGMFNYGVGRMGKEDWIYGMLRVRPERLEQSERFVHRYGAWMGLLSWLPILGSVITIAMGLLRVDVWKSALTILIGKVARYVVLGFLLEEL
ncbi:MAG: YqaA family protein [Bacteroidaceae bacterium]|nr:YqaA family protein [Bacteroidaceae bacterium]